MELSKNFEPQAIEKKWYQHWLDKQYFKSTPDEREPYTIVMPPPNVTGILHMGHCLNNTIQDILIRRARMQGKNACWVPGTDHASIATEAKVVGMLREKGIAKSSLTREEFLAYSWEWKEKYGGIILQQLKKLGFSLDWDRTTFTMDKDYYESVIKVFIELYKKGVIYRGKRMINWDVKALTALSDEEVIRKETKQKLYFLKYGIDGNRETAIGNEEFITIATVRPETIMGDTAIAVHPDDERYKHLHGKFAFVPLINKRIPIITDEYVTMEFGTGALKVTPAHDMNDNQLGQKHGLEVVDIFNDDGTLNNDAQIYSGLDRFAARKKIAVELEEKGFLVKTEDYTSEVGYSERNPDTVVEPRLSLQWWLSMKDLATPALKTVMDEEIKFYPPKFRNLYRHWMENIKDWCISRQLWWGHRIPAWYDVEGRFVVAETEAAAKEMFNTQYSISNAQLKQDEDCLDTWFSSWLWPFEVFKGYSNPGNKEIKYYYPTDTLVTAPEIIFFWVARMIMAGYEFMQEKPFQSVYFTGIVRDKQGRKMSKSLGNSPDLLGLIDQYGADATRFGIMIASPAGNDLLFDESSLEQGRNFNNKMWNALKLVKDVWRVAGSDISISGVFVNAGERPQQHDNDWIPQPNYCEFSIKWFDNRLQQVKEEINSLFREFKLSEALRSVYLLIWDDFCSSYLEWIKPEFGQQIDFDTHEETIRFFEELMLLLNPFMPFITEEIYHHLKKDNSDLVIKQLSEPGMIDPRVLAAGAFAKRLINILRNFRVQQSIKNSEIIELFTFADFNEQKFLKSFQKNIEKTTNTKLLLEEGLDLNKTYHRFLINNIEFCIEKKSMDVEKEKKRLLSELEYQKGFLQSVEKKLGNEKFVSNAKPEVLALEQKKKADAETKIRVIEESLAAL